MEFLGQNLFCLNKMFTEDGQRVKGEEELQKFESGKSLSV